MSGLKALAAGRSGGRFLLWVNPSQPTSPSEVPLHNKYEVLGLEGQVSEMLKKVHAEGCLGQVSHSHASRLSGTKET